MTVILHLDQINPLRGQAQDQCARWLVIVATTVSSSLSESSPSDSYERAQAKVLPHPCVPLPSLHLPLLYLQVLWHPLLLKAMFSRSSKTQRGQLLSSKKLP